jgi:shikimate dehydrogenase
VTDYYILLGENVLNSPTPRMMNSAFKALGLDAVYQTSNVGAALLGPTFAKIRDSGVSGLNVTIPHKTTITRLLDSLDDISSRIQAVNTVKKEGESYRGYNTDVDGILEPLKSRGVSRIKRAVVLGAGGASRAFCGVMHKRGCRELAVLSRDPQRAAGFLSSMRSAFPEIRIGVTSTENPPSWRPELFFNASPAGAKGIPLPAQMARVLEGRPVVFDAVYFPVKTDLIRLAGEMGCPVIYGHEMLLHQALKSLRIWTGLTPPRQVMKTTLFDSLGVAVD